jgi:hypothetical protein
MFGEMLDTPPEVRKKYYELLRALDVPARARSFESVCRRVRMFAEAGLRRRHPNASDEELRLRLTAQRYGQEVAQRLFGWLPDDLDDRSL